MSAKPEPWRTLSGEIRKIKEQIRRLSNASPFAGSGMRPDGSGGTVVYQTFVVEAGATSQIDPGGDLDVNGNANIDGTLNVGGPAQFGGDVEIVGAQVRSGNFATGVSGWEISGDGSAEFNDLTLREVPNSALETASAFLSDSASASFADVGTSYAQLLAVTFPDQPTLGNAAAPYTVAMAMIDAEVQVTNTTAATVTVSVSLTAGPGTLALGLGQSKEVTVSVATGVRATIPISMMRAADPGLASTSFQCRLLVKSSVALASHINNYAFMFASANFYRSVSPPP